MFPIIEPCILTNLFFVCTIHWVKVCEHLPTSDTFYKSVYYLTLAKKHQSQLIICSRAARWAVAWKEGSLIWKWVDLRCRRESFQGFSLKLLEFIEWIDYNRGVERKHPLQKWMLLVDYLNVLMDTAYPVDQTGWAFLFTLISLIEKGDNRYNQATKGYQQS